MGIKEIKNDLQGICKSFNLGVLSSWGTEKNTPINGYDTAFFKVEGSEKIYQYHFKNN